MNKKYIKIGFITFFVVFVIFVIIRKASIDEENTNTIQEKNEEPTTKVKEKKKEVDPRITLKLKDTTSKTKPEIKETPEKNIQKIEKEKIESVVPQKTSIIAKEKETISLAIEDPKNQITPEKAEVIEPIDAPVTTESKKIVLDIVEKKDIDEKLVITSIHELKDLKSDIKIVTNSKIFTYKNKNFKVGDYFGVFEIVSIEPKKIRFKKNDYFFYSLRFFIWETFCLLYL